VRSRPITTAHLGFETPEETLRAFNGLSDAIDNRIVGAQQFPANEIKVVIYFDESHTLSDVLAPTNPMNKTLYDVLCSALDHLKSRPLFTIFLSTNSHLATLAPSAALARSARALVHSGALQAPITETPFDCAPDLCILPGTLSLEDISDLEFMARFGRPLLVASLRALMFLASYNETMQVLDHACWRQGSKR